MADNSSIPVASGNETFANKDIGGVKFPKNIQYDSSGAEVVPATAAQIGEVQASPTANTVLDRLKAIATALAGTLTVATHAVTQSGSWVLSAGSNLIGKVGIDQTTDGTTNKVAADLRVAGAAVATGSGASGSTVPRVTLASDSPGVIAFGQDLQSASIPIVPASDYGVPFDTAKILNGSTTLTPKFIKIAASSSGVNVVVAAVTGKKIRVLAGKIVANAAVNFKWQSHTTPTDLTGLSYCGAQGDGEVLPFNPLGWFESLSGESLDINLSGAVAVGGHLLYVEV